jgi:hypothetical protein
MAVSSNLKFGAASIESGEDRVICPADTFIAVKEYFI